MAVLLQAPQGHCRRCWFLHPPPWTSCLLSVFAPAISTSVSQHSAIICNDHSPHQVGNTLLAACDRPHLRAGKKWIRCQIPRRTRTSAERGTIQGCLSSLYPRLRGRGCFLTALGGHAPISQATATASQGLVSKLRTSFCSLRVLDIELKIEATSFCKRIGTGVL